MQRAMHRYQVVPSNERNPEKSSLEFDGETPARLFSWAESRGINLSLEVRQDGLMLGTLCYSRATRVWTYSR